MKKLLFTLSLLLSAAMFSAFAQTSNDDPIVIIIKTGEIVGDGPRSPGNIPIEGVVSGGIIYLVFTSNLGNIEVRIDEITYGPLFHTIVDSSDLFAIIPFTLDPGLYYISFTLSSGQEYIGEFTI